MLVITNCNIVTYAKIVFLKTLQLLKLYTFLPNVVMDLIFSWKAQLRNTAQVV